jgi:hypothetical protein
VTLKRLPTILVEARLLLPEPPMLTPLQRTSATEELCALLLKTLPVLQVRDALSAMERAGLGVGDEEAEVDRAAVGVVSVDETLVRTSKRPCRSGEDGCWDCGWVSELRRESG